MASAEAWLQEQAQVIDRLKQAAHARDQVQLQAKAAEAPTETQNNQQNLVQSDTNSSTPKSVGTASDVAGVPHPSKNGHIDDGSNSDKDGNVGEQQKQKHSM